ncbi:MAG: tRNA epoxyqueuosine(34) reductase QueG [Planctomycetes bacterium]|nr:tRNA epoxyqueuosine(34) reductase QueG [Planctomycetota bacterium]
MTALLTKRESGTTLAALLKDRARRVGFDLVGIAPAVTPTGFPLFQDWLKRGHAGKMEYLPQREAAYSHPDNVLASVRSVIMLAVNYNTRPPTRKPSRKESKNQSGRETIQAQEPPESVTKSILSEVTVSAQVAQYAWGAADYHDVLRTRLRELADFLHEQSPDCRTRGVVDTAPLLERDFARLAGLGWFGKNTMLIDKRMGSWMFLAALLTDVELDYDEPHDSSHCGTCTRCLDACPTDAFPEPYVLDARRCIAYLTIELREQVPQELRTGVGSWLFGCDICQDVCPWNHKAPVTADVEFQPVEDLAPADAIAILQMTADEFPARFQQTPLSRPKRAGMLRNAAIVLGNARNPNSIPALIVGLNDDEPLVRGASAWALGRFDGAEPAAALQARLTHEDDPQVSGEIKDALEHQRQASEDNP